MSWDEITREDRKCPCKKGRYVIVLEADDWNRMRTRTEIRCPACAKKNKQAMSMIRLHEEKAHKLRKVAETEAKQRFLANFLSQFKGLSKKEIWEKLYAHSSYPALGTFYAHIRCDGSVESYLENYFVRKMDDFFPSKFSDRKIESLLEQTRTEKMRAEKVTRDWAVYLPRNE